MSRILPILFNGDMVTAILEDRKSVTRRIVRYRYSNTEMKMHTDKYGTRLIEIQSDVEGETYGKNPDGSTWHKLRGYIEKNPPYGKGDILYVRETWAFIPCSGCNGDYIRDGGPLNCYDYQAVEYDDGNTISDGCFLYRADCKTPEHITWRPSIHMPKQAARIWLKVTDVRVERLQEIDERGGRREGFVNDICLTDGTGKSAAKHFADLWDSTIKKSDFDRYGWNVNPWVWVIEFERCRRPKGGSE